MKVFNLILFFLIILSCDKKSIDNKNSQLIPSDYEELFTIMKKGFIDRDKVDWKNLERKVLEKSKLSKDLH
ncbi:hypothetical protein OBK25_04805 [Empedobacter falsenii]